MRVFGPHPTTPTIIVLASRRVQTASGDCATGNPGCLAPLKGSTPNSAKQKPETHTPLNPKP